MMAPYHLGPARAMLRAMRWLVLFLLIPWAAFGATSTMFSSARDTVTLVSQSDQPGDVTLGLKFQLNPGWHIYWSNPGDAGVPPAVAFAPPAMAGVLAFPPPALLVQPPVTDYVLAGDVLLPFAVKGAGAVVTADAHWLVCADICVPEHARFVLGLNGGASAEAGLFGPPVIVASPFAASVSADGLLRLAGVRAAQVKAAHFFPAAPGWIENGAAQALSFDDSGLSLQLTPAAKFDPRALTGVLELTDKSGAMQALAVAPVMSATAVTPVAVWLAFAFLGGLILNLMPCVFPILALKALAIIRPGGGAKIRAEAFAYTAGVLVAFSGLGGVLILARGLGAQIGWGFQLQSPVFVAAMALLILAIALNLAGVFKISGLQNIGSSLAARGSFFTGLLAVVVATPCTAPFMGGAIAAALAAPLPVAFGIFLALGLGLAAPFLLIACVPGVARLLPRPGVWMHWLQRGLSVPMVATFIWLAWVFVSQLNPAAPPLTLPGAQPFSATLLAQDRAGNDPVFVDMTAAWCVTCLVNEHSSLESQAVQAAFAAAHVKTLVGDWTNRNPEISAYLEANHRDGVPLYVFYPAGGGAPVILPQILTPEIVLRAIR